MSYKATDAVGSSEPQANIDTIMLSNGCNVLNDETRESTIDILVEESMGNRLSQSLPLASSGSCVCRICHTNNSKEPLISPCRCKGTLAFVHLSCLERWLNQSCRSHCELCRYHFNAVETPRYGWSESLRIWISHPRNRRHVQSDLLILTLLTVVTVGLVAVCILGMRYFVIEGRKIGVSRLWTRGSISFFLTIIVLGYVTTVYLLAKVLTNNMFIERAYYVGWQEWYHYVCAFANRVTLKNKEITCIYRTGSGVSVVQMVEEYRKRQTGDGTTGTISAVVFRNEKPRKRGNIGILCYQR